MSLSVVDVKHVTVSEHAIGKCLDVGVEAGVVKGRIMHVYGTYYRDMHDEYHAAYEVYWEDDKVSVPFSITLDEHMEKTAVVKSVIQVDANQRYSGDRFREVR